MIIEFREPVAHRDPTGKTHPSAVGKTKIKTAESNGGGGGGGGVQIG